MPYESLTCPKCGSADCQEVKPGTHFCNHCDNVFRYVPPTEAGRIRMPAGCEKLVKGRPCEVPAAGRCLTCGEAFCTTHQAVTEGRPYVDLCAACKIAVPLAREAQLRATREARAEEYNRAAERAVAEVERLKQLILSRCQMMPRREARRVEQRGIFGPRLRTVIVDVEPVVPIGQLHWHMEPDGSIEARPRLLESGLTASGKIICMSPAGRSLNETTYTLQEHLARYANSQGIGSGQTD